MYRIHKFISNTGIRGGSGVVSSSNNGVVSSLLLRNASNSSSTAYTGSVLKSIRGYSTGSSGSSSGGNDDTNTNNNNNNNGNVNNILSSFGMDFESLLRDTEPSSAYMSKIGGGDSNGSSTGINESSSGRRVQPQTLEEHRLELDELQSLLNLNIPSSTSFNNNSNSNQYSNKTSEALNNSINNFNNNSNNNNNNNIKDKETESIAKQSLRSIQEELDRIYSKMENDNMSKEETAKLTEMVELQTKFEMDVTEEARQNYRQLLSDTHSIKRANGLRPIKNVMFQWYKPLFAQFEKKVEIMLMNRDTKEAMEMLDATSSPSSLNNIDDSDASLKEMDIEQEQHYSRMVEDILRDMDIKKLSLISLNQIVGQVLSKPEGVQSNTVIESIGDAILLEHRLAVLKATDKVAYKRIMKPYEGLTPRSIQNMMRTHFNVKVDEESIIVYRLGSFALEVIMDSCKVEKYQSGEQSEYINAFYHDYKYSKNKRLSIVRCHANVFQNVQDGHELRESMHARLLPMVVPPEQWKKPYNGCYLHYPTFIMRTNGSKLQQASLRSADLTNIYQGLNILGEVPWNINRKVLSILEEAWENGGGIGDLPSRYDFSAPDVPKDYETDSEARKQHLKSTRKVKQLNNDLHSMRCDTTYKLNVGRQFVDYTFYFPHNVDFRGRSYPIPPHLNHLGADFCRAMLTFAQKKPLGERGFLWLKVHLANLFGVDKISFDDRIDFTDSHMEDIIDSADHPLDGRRWWLKADSPWQTLASCIELVNAIRSGNPAAYESNIPVHQDGTCNGLQHYAALGGDEMGALKVNLLPSPKPQDVYSGVAQLVAQSVAADAAKGDPIAQLLDGKVERKIIKQTVMTSVYGVTFIGAREQIQNALSEKYDMDDATLWKASSYLAKETFKSLDKMFLGARGIMSWLAECAGSIAKSGECVAWYTPLGLPVVQPYKKGGKFSVKTFAQEFMLVNDENDLPVCSRSQRTAFPPNYIHSLDSTHMFLTALECKKQAITYASVHDSFWTHAATIDQMNGILRHQFVELHSRSLLQDLKSWFEQRYPNVAIPDLPAKGNLDLSKVKESKYFFH